MSILAWVFPLNAASRLRVLALPGLDSGVLASPGLDSGVLTPLGLDSGVLAPPGLDFVAFPRF